MTPDDLETRLAGRPIAGAIVAALVEELRADPDWTVGEVEVDGRPVTIELLHHPSGAAYTLSHRRGSALRQGAPGPQEDRTP